MPKTTEQDMLRLPLAGQLSIRSFPPAAASETENIDSFLRRFDGHKKFMTVLQQLDEELAALVAQEHAALGLPLT
jgi:hypothetical protein